jgi:hypothetical protein
MTTAAEHRHRTIHAWTEKQFQKQVIALARTLGWWTMHHYDSRRSTPGWPDLVLIRDHQALFVELKAEKGRLSADQENVINMLLGAGLNAQVWRPRHWADGTIHTTLGATNPVNHDQGGATL